MNLKGQRKILMIPWICVPQEFSGNVFFLPVLSSMNFNLEFTVATMVLLKIVQNLEAVRYNRMIYIEFKPQNDTTQI